MKSAVVLFLILVTSYVVSGFIGAWRRDRLHRRQEAAQTPVAAISSSRDRAVMSIYNVDTGAWGRLTEADVWAAFGQQNRLSRQLWERIRALEVQLREQGVPVDDWKPTV